MFFRNRLATAAALISVGLLAGCVRAADHVGEAHPQAVVGASAVVAFDIRPILGPNNWAASSKWLATYSRGGKSAVFGIELDPRLTPDTRTGFSLGKGSFVSEPRSDATTMLMDLKNALEASKLPANVHRVARLPFTFVVLGQNQSKSPDGGFSDEPKGDWIITKDFLSDGDAEVYLNLNLATERGEFAEKDKSYGDVVLRELAKVL